MDLKGFKFILKGLLILGFAGLIGCDVNKVREEETDPNISDPDNSAAQNVGPVEQLVTIDVLSKTNEIRDNILTFMDEATGGDDVFSGGTEKLKTRFVDDDFFQEPIQKEIDLSEAIPCDEGGSKDIIGTATFTLNADRVTGSIVGDFTIQYDNCQDTIVLSVSDGNCATTPTVDGELENTLSVTYTLSVTDDQGQQVFDDTTVDATNSAALAVSVGSSATTQTYNFTYTLASASATENLEGTVSFQNKLYDLVELEEFVAGSTTSVVCP